MAILSNGKFYGFLCSAKETGQKLANGVKEYVEILYPDSLGMDGRYGSMYQENGCLRSMHSGYVDSSLYLSYW